MKTSVLNSALRRGVVTALVTTLSLCAAAQRIDWGPKFKSSKNYRPEILGEDDKYFYSTYTVVKGMFSSDELDIEKFDKATKQRIFNQKIELYSDVKGRKAQVMERIVFAGDKFLTFHSYFDKKADETVIYANVYSTENGKTIAKNKNIMTVPVEKKSRRGNFSVVVSENGKKILISHVAYYKKQEKVRERMILIDDHLDKITEREDAVGGDSRGDIAEVGSRGLALDNDGTFYFEKNTSSGNTKIVTFDANKDYEKWEEEINLKTLGLPVSGMIFNTSVAMTRKKDLVIAGFYSKDSKTLDGTYIMKLDGKSKEVVVNKLNDFDQAFKDQFKSKKDIKKNKDGKVDKGVGRMRLYRKDDGGVVGVGEYKTHYVFYDRNGNVSGESYTFGDMIVVNLDKDGDMQWAQRLRKSQVFQYNNGMWPFIFSSTGFKMFAMSVKPLDYMGYFAAMGKDKFYVAFNDNAKNLAKKGDLEKLKPFKKPNQAVMSIYTIDLATGEKKKSAFFGGKDYSITVEPNTVFQSKQSSAPIITGSRNSNFRFGTMVLD